MPKTAVAGEYRLSRDNVPDTATRRCFTRNLWFVPKSYVSRRVLTEAYSAMRTCLPGRIDGKRNIYIFTRHQKQYGFYTINRVAENFAVTKLHTNRFYLFATNVNASEDTYSANDRKHNRA